VHLKGGTSQILLKKGGGLGGGWGGGVGESETNLGHLGKKEGLWERGGGGGGGGGWTIKTNLEAGRGIVNGRKGHRTPRGGKKGLEVSGSALLHLIGDTRGPRTVLKKRRAEGRFSQDR